MSLKIASLEDRKDYLRLCQTFYEHSPFFPQVQYNQDKVARLLDLAVSSQYTQVLPLLLLESNKVVGLLVGLASSTPFSDDIVVSELAWWVDEEYRGTKGSIELVYAYEEWARRVGAKHITMALLPSLTNPKVESYYEKMGYKKTEISYIKEA